MDPVKQTPPEIPNEEEQEQEPESVSDLINKPQQQANAQTPYLGKEAPRAQTLWQKLTFPLWIVGLLILVLLFNVFIGQPFQVDGESMTPTLQNGELMYVLKAPKTWAGITNSQYIPGRGRVVIVRTEGQMGPENFVKRVVGLPGERVVIKNGKITVFNTTNPDGFNPDDTECCRELAETSGNIDAVVQEGHVFVVGDNRETGGSIDSRSGLGAIPAEHITGQVMVRFWPINQFRTL